MKTNAKNKISIGVVGCGAIAEIYHLPALRAHAATCSAIQLADTNETRMKELAARFDVQHYVTDYRDLTDVDAVIVATPPASHFAICHWFLSQGKHVLCEKPLTEDAEQARELVELASRQGVQLAVNQTRRFFPTYQKIRELLQSSTLGELKSITYHDGVEFDWPAASPHHFSPGAKGAWSDTGVHLLDTICYWLGEKPRLTGAWHDGSGGPEAIATVRLEHRACSIELKVSRLGRLRNGFKIVGTEGMIEADAEQWSEVRVVRSSGQTEKHRCGSKSLKYTDFATPLLADFVEAIQTDSNVAVSGASVLPTVELLAEAYNQAQPFGMPWNKRLKHLRLNESQPGNVLVTGASGFVGGRVVEALHLTDLARPIGTIRNWSRAARVARYPVELQLCDIRDRDNVKACMQGIESVVHCAKTDDRDSIVGGTRNLLQAAKDQGVGSFVFLSTAEVYGPNVSGEVREDAPLPKTGRLYADAKIEAEEVCREFSSPDFRVTILRPSLIYGPFSTSWSIDIAKRLQSGNWGTFAEQGSGFANLIYIDDLVQAILRALTSNSAAGDSGAGQAFNVCGPDRLTWNEFFEIFNTKLGLPALRTISTTKSKLKTRVMDTVGMLADKVLDRYEDQLMEIYLRGGLASRVMKRIKGEINSTPTGNELNDLFTRRAHYDDARAKALLGYQPAFDIHEGLELTAAWLGLHEAAINRNRWDEMLHPVSVARRSSTPTLREVAI